MIARPTGIIRTLPTLYGNASEAKRKFEQSLTLVESGKLSHFFVTMQAIPKIDVLHLYILVEGFIRVRANIAGYEPCGELRCWDGTVRSSKYVAVCSAPISYPPEPIKRRGFQGFRYCEELW